MQNILWIADILSFRYFDIFDFRFFQRISGINLKAFIATLAITIYWMGKLNSEVSRANCVLSKIPSDLLDGTTDSAFEFLGVSNYLDVMNDFQEESGKILSDNLSDNFDVVIAAKVSEEVKPYEEALRNFKSNFQGWAHVENVA